MEDIDAYILRRAQQMVDAKRGGSRVGDWFKRTGRKIKRGYNKAVKSKVGRAIRNVGKKVLPAVAGIAATALGAPELAIPAKLATSAIVGSGMQHTLIPAKSGGKRKQSAKMKARGELVRKLMKQEGMTLGEASRFIKQNNLM